MTKDNLRDLYSARREGTLESGLTGVFDERLAADPEIREDYDAFIEACDALDLGAQEQIVSPDWLSARILDRLDLEPAVGVRRVAGSAFGWPFSLRSLGFAGLGVVALLGAGFAVWRGADGAVATASVVPMTGDRVASAGDALRPVVENGRVFVDLQSPGAHDVSIFAGPGGALLKRFPVNGARLHSELVSNQVDPFVFEVRVDREPRPLLVVLPGTDRSRSAASGTGDLVLFAKALARTYGTPVALRVNAPKTAVTWNLQGAQAQSEALRTLDGLGFAVDVMPGGLLSVQDH